MMQIRRSQERGYADHGWLKSFHSFSFANYYDPKFMGWGNLRVINEDRIDPGTGFGEHSHRDMEIISYVLSGELAHKDSMGNVKSIPPGDIQRMSAGTGVTHSEFNYAKDQTTHFLQIWIQPKFTGVKPGYEQKTILAGTFDGAQYATLAMDPSRKAYVHLIKGALTVNGQRLSGGDAAMIANESRIEISQGEEAEVLVFDLA
jgi:redox-sensitive bicupin YhaK (pirin superfamily)